MGWKLFPEICEADKMENNWMNETKHNILEELSGSGRCCGGNGKVVFRAGTFFGPIVLGGECWKREVGARQRLA